MVASGNAVMLWLPAPSFSLSLLICSSCWLIISLLTTCSFFFLFFAWPLIYFFPLFFPPLLAPRSISLTNIDWWRQSGSGAVHVSDGGVCSRHSLLRSASIDSFWCIFNTFTSYFSLWIITACTDGWLPRSTGKIELFACNNAEQNLLQNTFAGWME